MIALINPQAPKGRPDVKHGCNPCAITPSAQHGCNPCAVTPARNGCNPRKTKTLLLALLLALLAPAAARAQEETLTLYDGTRICYDVPLNLPALRQFTRSQFVIPADNLMEMTNGTISGMKFYAKSGSSFTSDCTVYVYLMEVDYTAISAFEPQSYATIVYQGTIEIVQTANFSELTISFNQPYPYTGGNLLVGMDNMEKASSSESIYFYGTTVEGASISGLGNYVTNISTFQCNFIPKTSLTYTPSACGLPETLEAEDITPHQATLSWTGGSGTYNLETKTGNGEWTRILTSTTAINYTWESLADSMDYQARVQAVCGNETSGWRSVTFSTPIACFTPTGLAVTLNPDDTTEATLSWTENGEATAWQICLDDDEANLIEADSNPFTLTNLSLGTAHTVKVRAYCNDIDQSTWSNTVSFTPSFSITVHDGTQTNCHAPVNLHWSDEFARSQFVIPAVDLVAMAGGTISGMTFYTTSQNIPFTYNKPVDVYLMEVDYKVFNPNNPQFEPKTNATIVYQGPFQIISTDNGGELTIYFSEPYHYNYGNLLVGIEDTQKGITFRSVFFYGTTATSASVFGCDEYYSNLSAEQNDFIPKTTFSYTPSACGLPETLEAENISAHQATLSWTGGSGTYNVETKAGHGEWTRVYTDLAANSCTLENLMPCTEYQARVQSVCDNATSDWRIVQIPMTITHEVPYSEGFESPQGTYWSEDGPIAACWRGYSESLFAPHNSIWPSNAPNYAHGTQALSFYTADANTYAILPEFSNPLSELQISFWMYIPGNNSRSIELGYITSEDNTFCNTFTTIATYYGDKGNIVQHNTVLADVPAEAQCLVFRWIAGEAVYEPCFIDDVEVSINPLAYNFGGGSGTETDPYIIATTDDMDALAALVNGGNSYNGKFFKMTADLDFSGKDYSPIGNTSCGFKGTFNGNGHTISHVIIQSTRNFIGLFGLLESEGSVNGLTLGEGSSIHGFNRVGGIVGQCSGAINGCNIVEGVTIRADKTFVGGIVGDCVGGNVSNCQNHAAVSSNTYACGGIVGILSSGGEVLQCSNYGFVQASENCGGIVGGLVDCSMVTECINEGNISGNEKVGGIVGGLVDCSMVTECINEGSISGNEKVGGIAGFINNQDGNCFCSVSNCLNLGGVSASNSNNLGSISGNMNVGANFNNNYYAGECTVGGINGNDVAGEAMRGYAIEPQQPLGISLEGSIGVFYDGKVYAGENQEAIVGFEVTSSSIVPQCFTLSAGTYTDNGDGTYTITMPAEDITVSDNIVVEFYGTYYEIPCNGGTTATVIYDISYDTLDYVGIEDFEYGGIQYTVTAIADGAFDGCSDLLGFGCHAPQLATIGANAFRNCTNMDNFGFFNCATPPIVGEGAFENVPLEDILLGVPYCSQYDYGQHEVFGQCGNVQGYELCEYNFMGFGGDGLWSNPANWMDANSELCTNLPGEGAQVAIFAECEIDVDVTVESITNANYEEVLPLTVKTGVTLTATEYVYTSTTPGNLIIKDGAQVYHPNTGAQATVEKNITAYTPNSKNGWHLVSSPAIESFAPTADNGFLANEYDLYFYEEPTHHWRNHKPNGQYANFNIEPLKGYLYANSANDTLQLQGTLRTAMETVNFPLSYTDGIALAGFNLVGNPFAHNVTSFTGSNVATEVYRMNETKDELTVANITATDPLKPGEGFFVKATGDEASITFNSRATNTECSNITLEVSENGLLVDRFILKRDGAPLEKFTLNENSTRVYATEGAQDWAVAVIASEAKQSSPTEQPINFKAAKNGTYTLTVNVENMDLDYLHLIDNLTGADVDLLTPPAFGHPLSEGEAQSGAESGSDRPATDSRTLAGVPPLQRGQGGFNYTFTAKTTDYASRFRLVFSNDDAGEDACEPPFAYISNGNIVITADASDATLQIVDVMGRVIASYGGHKRYVTTNGMLAGVYVLRLINGDKVRVQKIVIE